MRQVSATVPEYERMVYTRFRLSAHNLRGETGRWSRVPREAMVCDCTHGGIQNQLHVIKYCLKLSSLKAEVFRDIV